MIKTIDYKHSKHVMLVATIPPLGKQEDCAFKESLRYKMSYIQFSLGYMKPCFFKKQKIIPKYKIYPLISKIATTVKAS